MTADTAPTIALTPRQAEVLVFIAEYHADRGVAPTLEEIGRFLGVHRTTAHDHVLGLTFRGALTTDHHGRPRCMRITEAGALYVQRRADAS